ncbi:hydroxymethylbilane synthase [Demequina zhanjiangensis]|uniref:Hydroxymethylbilane synthase n=1 Tax=Demequina zhanjiangensis TaxID=3051659 RepID=A0ABT8G047_9MICO|nr:hydroxymethylbilane synthase [Demequina sp. SYSU T00b26]MDN4472452.1 hydroxymethylbilane synthase [Demequina sp. SYSU T00b26]
MHLRLGTRGSALATTQSQHVADALAAVAAERGIDAQVVLEIVTTHGDVSRTSLVGLSTTGVFVNALRDHLLAGDCDLLVHSLKDIPVEPHPELDIAAIPAREDVRDALCTTGTSLLTLPEGAKIGTGSPRRAAQLRKARPDLEVVDIRGNVDTRLGRVGSDLDGVVLAAAGLSRLGRIGEATELIPVDVMVPAPGQGALAVEIRQDADPQLRELVHALDDPATRAGVTAERTALAVLEAGCSAPVGAYATVADGELRLHLRVTDASGSLQLNEMARGPLREAASIGRAAAYALLGRGAARLMGAR